MAPFLPSWLGNGTSRRAAFIGGGVPGLLGIVAGVFRFVALLEELEDRKAVLPARNGSSAVAGLTVHYIRCGIEGVLSGGGDAPRRAIEAADLVVDNIMATETRKIRAVEEWRGSNAGWRMSKSWDQLMRSRKFRSWRIFD